MLVDVLHMDVENTRQTHIIQKKDLPAILDYLAGQEERLPALCVRETGDAGSVDLARRETRQSLERLDEFRLH